MGNRLDLLNPVNAPQGLSIVMAPVAPISVCARHLFSSFCLNHTSSSIDSVITAVWHSCGQTICRIVGCMSQVAHRLINHQQLINSIAIVRHPQPTVCS